MTIVDFKDLKVWQKAIDLVVSVYGFSKELPAEERFGLQSQLRRAAVSIASNIAEGQKRSSRKDYANFLRISLGSAAELETQLIICERLYTLGSLEETKSLITEVEKMLTVMIKKLQTIN